MKRSDLRYRVAWTKTKVNDLSNELYNTLRIPRLRWAEGKNIPHEKPRNLSTKIYPKTLLLCLFLLDKEPRFGGLPENTDANL